MSETPSYTVFSEIAVSDLVNYLRISEPTSADNVLLTSILEAAKNYVLGYTGQDEEAADTFPEFTIAVYVLAQDMYDNRSYAAVSPNVNKIVDSILGLHSINLL